MLMYHIGWSITGSLLQILTHMGESEGRGEEREM